MNNNKFNQDEVQEIYPRWSTANLTKGSIINLPKLKENKLTQDEIQQIYPRWNSTNQLKIKYNKSTQVHVTLKLFIILADLKHVLTTRDFPAEFVTNLKLK